MQLLVMLLSLRPVAMLHALERPVKRLLKTKVVSRAIVTLCISIFGRTSVAKVVGVHTIAGILSRDHVHRHRIEVVANRGIFDILRTTSSVTIARETTLSQAMQRQIPIEERFGVGQRVCLKLKKCSKWINHLETVELC